MTEATYTSPARTIGLYEPKSPVGLKSPSRVDRPRSDLGTFLLHWLVSIACLVSMLTGFRWTADAETAVISQWFSPIFLQGEIWTWHVVSGLAMLFGMSAYAVYMIRAGLKRRVAIGRLRVFTLPTASRLKWGAVNIALHWLAFTLLVLSAVTGILLYIGYGGVVVTLHLITAVGLTLYIVAHATAHFFYGGLQQWLRLFRPAALVVNRAMRPFPLAVASLIGVGVGAAFVATDWTSRDTLVVIRTTTPPKLDGVLDDAVWAAAKSVFIRTQQGSGLSGTGESLVEVRAAKSAEHIHFAFRWQDPTRSLKRVPLIKRADGWHLLHNKADIADESAYYEDKFAVLFTRTATFGAGGTTHMGPNPKADIPSALNKRGLHYTTDGTIADLWQWKASRGGLLGYVDDMYIGPPMAPNERHKMNTQRYSGGYNSDPGRAFYSYNYVGEPPGGYRSAVKIRFLPKDWRATQDKLGRIDLSPDAHDDENTQWWMYDNEVVPYNAELDREIPVGTIMPSVIISGEYEGDRADVRCGAKWADGWWTLEVTRKLQPSSKYDTDFEGTLYLWVGVFDHNQTRHTRHMRPVRLEFR